MVNLPWVQFGGVRAEDGLGVGSLILTPIAFFLMSFLIFLGGSGVEATLCLLARVSKYSALGPFDEALTGLALGV
jgi:hypothetical protein